MPSPPPGASLFGDLRRLYRRVHAPAAPNRLTLEAALNYLLTAHATERRTFWPLPDGFPLSRQLRASLPTIVAEYTAYVSRNRSGEGDRSLPLLRELDPDAGKSSNHGTEWRTRFLTLYHHEFAEARHDFPRTFAILDQDSTVVSVFFSLTRGSRDGSALQWHRGAFRGVLRYHLPIIVPMEAAAGELVSGSDGVPAHGAIHLEVLRDHEVEFEGDAQCAADEVGAPCRALASCANKFHYSCLEEAGFDRDYRCWSPMEGGETAYGDFLFEDRNAHVLRRCL